MIRGSSEWNKFRPPSDVGVISTRLHPAFVSRHLVNINPLVTMLSYAIIFLIIALIAGVLGFGVVAGTAATIAKILFVVFLILFVVSLIRGRGRNL